MKLSTEQKLAIHELLGRAAYAYDERDMQMLENGFADNAGMSMRIAGGEIIGPFNGRDAIMELMRSSMAQQADVRRHVVSNIFFEENGENPVAISNLTLVSTLDGKAEMLATGVYRDELIEQGGAWRILKRHLELDSSY
ncbi:MAG: nuclear transport factor 2 family protein [Gammaproteobacteria bacterium]|nr:nuclear transport factor 2 family protein [Gammaproteobacteria bacterium]MDH5170960.1 nuclear transport factor 2 family protein [Gammaproteobacteria bacterium]